VPAAESPRVLVIVLCETRGWEITSDSFLSNVVEPLSADVALCVGRTGREQPNPFYERAKYVWAIDEPESWSETYERETGGREWEALLRFNPQFLAPIPPPSEPEGGTVPGSGAVVFFFRRVLRRCLEETRLLDAYDWFVITRSDFLWPRPHPPVAALDDRFLYALDGERYGGLSDRHHVVPRALMPAYLDLVEPIFSDPVALAARIDSELGRRRGELNPELFWALRLKELGVWDRVRYLPYLPYTVRGAEGSTRWAQGTWHEEGRYYVKYPYELARSRAVQQVIDDEASWQRYYAPWAGLLMRMRVVLAHRILNSRQSLATTYTRFMRWLLLRLNRHPDSAASSTTPAR
jgi:hypothetical protein